MLQRQPKSTHTVTLVPYTQLSRIGTMLALPRLHHGQIELRESHLLHPQSQGSPASVVPRCGGVGVAMPHKVAHGLLRHPRLPCGCRPALPELSGRTATFALQPYHLVLQVAAPPLSERGEEQVLLLALDDQLRSEEHTSELQSLMR